MTNHLATRGAALALFLFPIAACAQPADQQSTATRTGGAASGGVALLQYFQRHERKLMADDTDGDGKISKVEFLAAAKAGKGDPAKRFARMDGNGDGLLDRTEIDAMLTRRFRRQDTSGDGVLSPNERAAVRRPPIHTAGWSTSSPASTFAPPGSRRSTTPAPR